MPFRDRENLLVPNASYLAKSRPGAALCTAALCLVVLASTGTVGLVLVG